MSNPPPEEAHKSCSPILEVESLSKCYNVYGSPSARLKQALFRNRRRYFKEFWALRDVSFSVFPGETIGLLGRNGSGKSTLLQLIAGTTMPTVGTTRRIGRLAALLELGSGFNFEFTGRENALLSGSIIGVPAKQMTERMGAIAEFADIGEFFDRPVKTFSTGMFARLAFAVNIHVDADILIIDEALAVGDEKFQRKCYDRLHALREKGCTILFVSHSVSIIEQICTKALLLDQGKLVASGEPKTVITEYHRRLYSDENTYLRQLAETQSVSSPKVLPKENKHAFSVNSGTPSCRIEIMPDPPESEKGHPRATIVHATACNIQHEDQYVFRSGEIVVIKICVHAKDNLENVIAGVRLRTLQGVEVFGTSTLYFRMFAKIPASHHAIFSFSLKLSLCENTYAVSVAIAECLSESDMRYLDKLSDVFFLKVVTVPFLASGLAHLDTTCSWELQ